MAALLADDLQLEAATLKVGEGPEWRSASDIGQPYRWISRAALGNPAGRDNGANVGTGNVPPCVESSRFGAGAEEAEAQGT
jgi:hypothetical protein